LKKKKLIYVFYAPKMTEKSELPDI